MQLPDFLTADNDGDIRLTGHRIGLYHVVARYNDGESAEMIANRYPTLPLSLVHRVIAFYLDNQGEIDTYVASYHAKLERQQESGHMVDLDEFRRRVAAQTGTVAKAE